LLGTTAGAADLTKIDRTLAKEPTYKTKSPKYCLLVFGPQAAHRIWLVLDGDHLYVDKNGNGDLTEDGERVTAGASNPSEHPAHERERSIRVGDLTVDGLTHAELTVGQTEYRRKVDTSRGVGGSTAEEWQAYLDDIWRKVPGGTACMVSVKLDPRCYGTFAGTKAVPVTHFAWLDENGHLAFADQPSKAPVLHFGGPLRPRVHHTTKLQHGPGADVTVYLGSRGVGPGSFVCMCYDHVPATAYPVLEAEFPPKELGGKPVRTRYELKQRC
jgi:hypothetical protein